MSDPVWTHEPLTSEREVNNTVKKKPAKNLRKLIHGLIYNSQEIHQ